MAEKMTKQKAYTIMEAYNKWRTSPGTFYPHSRANTDAAFNIVMGYVKEKMTEEGVFGRQIVKEVQDGKE